MYPLKCSVSQATCHCIPARANALSQTSNQEPWKNGRCQGKRVGDVLDAGSNRGRCNSCQCVHQCVRPKHPKLPISRPQWPVSVSLAQNSSLSPKLIVCLSTGAEVQSREFPRPGSGSSCEQFPGLRGSLRRQGMHWIWDAFKLQGCLKSEEIQTNPMSCPFPNCRSKRTAMYHVPEAVPGSKQRSPSPVGQALP